MVNSKFAGMVYGKLLSLVIDFVFLSHKKLALFGYLENPNRE